MKKNNIKDENLEDKKFSLYLLLIISVCFSPFIFMLLFNLVLVFVTLNFDPLFNILYIILLLFSFYWVLVSGLIDSLIYGKSDAKLFKSKVMNKKPIVSITEKKEFDARVEGIIGDRERDIIDKDDDGHILVHEFYPLTESEVLFKVLKQDNDFSKKEFCDYVRSLFYLMQEAWSNNNYFKLRSFEADRLYLRHKREIEGLIAANEKDIRDKIVVKGVLLKDFRIENNKQILVVALTANMRRKIGRKVTQEDYPYIFAFSRNLGVKTNKNVKLSITNCCNCGAEVNVSDDGICNYCDTSLVSGEHEWVLVDMKLINIGTDFRSLKKD